MDITFGTYPFNPDSDMMQKTAWIFQPYTDSRISGKLNFINNKEIENIVNRILIRIDNYVNGKGKKIRLDTKYKIIYSGNNWTMIKEIGGHARAKLFWDGIKAFVSVEKRQDGKYIYTLGKTAPFIPFPIQRLHERFNKIERISKKDTDRWGGGDIIGGSPREKGSRLKPDEVIKIINNLVNQ